MKSDPLTHRRRSIRLKGYDYSQSGYYYVTICTQKRECLFGDVVNGVMVLNDAGRMVKKYWYKLKHKFMNSETCIYGGMPNHIHGILIIKKNGVGANPCVRPGGYPDDRIFTQIQTSLGKMIQWFKTMTTNEYIRGVKQKGWKSFDGKFWQRNYYEHVIRNEAELENIRKYITDNPLKWPEDEYNPMNT
jgi:putative transposase